MLRSACAYAQSDQSLCSSLEYSVSVKLLTEHHLVLLSLTGGLTGSSESTLVKMRHCWKSHAAAQILSLIWNTDHLMHIGMLFQKMRGNNNEQGDQAMIVETYPAKG